jgi:hypothetical protein
MDAAVEKEDKRKARKERNGKPNEEDIRRLSFAVDNLFVSSRSLLILDGL